MMYLNSARFTQCAESDGLAIGVRSARSIPWHLALRLNTWKRRTFGKPYLTLAPAEWLVLGTLNWRYVTAVEIATRDARAGETPVKLACLGAVRTAKDLRCRGLGRTTINDALRFAHDSLSCDFAFLMCDASTLPFYKSCGFTQRQAQLVFDQPAGPVQSDLLPMIRPLRRPKFPEGRIDLCGLPF